VEESEDVGGGRWLARPAGVVSVCPQGCRPQQVTGNIHLHNQRLILICMYNNNKSFILILSCINSFRNIGQQTEALQSFKMLMLYIEN